MRGTLDVCSAVEAMLDSVCPSRSITETTRNLESSRVGNESGQLVIDSDSIR